jgi:hypothetical protein
MPKTVTLAALAVVLAVGVRLSSAHAGDVIGPCPGDCNGDRTVNINELVIAVDIALQLQPPTICPASDPDGDQRVAIHELIRLVNRALSPC